MEKTGKSPGVGKGLMIQQDYIPSTCTLPEAMCLPLVFAEIKAGRSPCWGCNADREECKGKPKQGNDEVLR